MIINSFVFLDEGSPQSVSDTLGNTNGTLLTFEVISSEPVQVKLEGRTAIEEDNWTQLAVISGNKLSVVETIAESGNYFAPITGISSIRFVNDGSLGSVKIFGKISNGV